MPDITMCINEDCPVKMTCHRYTATRSVPQSFALFKWDDTGCDHFWLNDDGVRLAASRNTRSE